MNKVILTAPNGKVYITKTPYDINDSFNALAPSIKDTTKFFTQKDLTFIKETLIREKHLKVTAIDGMQFIAQGSQIYTVPLDGRKKEAKKLSYFAWDNAYRFIKDNKDVPEIHKLNPRGITEFTIK